MTGSTERELTSRPFTEFIHSEDREIVARFSKTGKGVGEELPMVRFIERTGATLWLEINAVPFPWQGQKALLCMARNITSQVLMKAQLEEAQKLEAVGILSGGLAHDFNNLLQGISGYTGLLALRPNLSENDKEKLNAINKLIGRATHLIKQLLLFSRKVESQLRPVEVNKAVQSVVEMLRTVLPKMVEIRLDLLNAPLTIQADPVQFEQILMNLSLNAKDAMNEGVLTVSTDIAVVDEETIPSTGPHSRQVRLPQGRDTGRDEQGDSDTFSNPSTRQRALERNRPRSLHRLRIGEKPQRGRHLREHAGSRDQVLPLLPPGHLLPLPSSRRAAPDERRPPGKGGDHPSGGR